MAIYENEIFQGEYRLPDKMKAEVSKFDSKIKALHYAFIEVFPWTYRETTIEDFEALFAFQVMAQVDNNESINYYQLDEEEEKEAVDNYLRNYQDHVDSWKQLISLLHLTNEQTEEMFQDIWQEIASEMIQIDIVESISRKKTYTQLHIYGSDPFRFIHCISPSLLLNDFELLVKSDSEYEYIDAVFIREVREPDNDAIAYLEDILTRKPLKPTRPLH